MLPMNADQAWALAQLIVWVLAVGGILGGILAWWIDMKNNKRR